MRRVLLAALVSCAVAGAPASAGGARPVSTATRLSSARQMLVVTTPGWNAVRGTLYAFERGADGAWVPARWAAGTPREDAARGLSFVVGKDRPAGGPGAGAAIPGLPNGQRPGRAPHGMGTLPLASRPGAAKLGHFATIGVTEVVMRLPSAGRDDVMPELDRQAELVATLRA